MSLIIQKYGGSSLADAARIRAVAARIVRAKRQGHRVVAVVSAMGDTTDDLIKLAYQVTPLPQQRELDMLLTAGERISMSLVAMAIADLGEEAISFTGSQVGIITDARHTRARILEIKADRLKEALSQGRIAIVAGFQGVSLHREVTTLGRGGSDTTAVALAAAMEADLCEIYSDVDGIYTADPRLVPEARRLPFISYDEILEMASSGAQVLHHRAAALAARHRVVVRCRSSFSQHRGTLIGKPRGMERVTVKGIAHDRVLSLITITGLPRKGDIGNRIAARLAEQDIPLKAWLQSWEDRSAGLMMAVGQQDLETVLEIVKGILGKSSPAVLRVEKETGSVSIIGSGVGSEPAIISKALAAMGKLRIGVTALSATETKITLFIDRRHTERAVMELHKIFIG